MTESAVSQSGVQPIETAGHGLRPARFVVFFLLVVIVGGGWRLSTGWSPWAAPARSLVASGSVEADEVLIGAEVLGRIVAIAEEGAPVQADEEVVQLDDSLLQVQIRQAPLAQRQQLEVQAKHFHLTSPISGVVTRSPMHVGETVSPGQTVMAVADLTRMRLTVYVLEKDLGQVQVGQAVAVTADPFPGKVFRGLVTSTNPKAEFTPRNVQTQADRLNLVFGVKLRVENPEALLKPGMPADAHFLTASAGGQP